MQKTRIISKRYENDGKPEWKLNGIQKRAKGQYIKKIRNGQYKYYERSCDCGESFENLVLISEKDRYGIPIDTRICKKCGLISANPYLNQDALNEFYDKEYRALYTGKQKATENFFDEQEESAEHIWKFIKENVPADNFSVLEIGCGAGGILQGFSHYTKGEIVGIDLGDDYLEYGRAKGLNLYQMSAEEFYLSSLKNPEGYDVIILSHVLEHFLDIDKELKVIRNLLSMRGILYVEVPGLFDIPNVYGQFLTYLQNAHVRYFCKGTLIQIMNKNGFEEMKANEKIMAVFAKGTPKQLSKSFCREEIEYIYKIEKNHLFLIGIRKIRDKINGYRRKIGKDRRF